MQMDSPYDTVHASGMIVTDLIWADTDVFEYFIQRLTMMSVCYRSDRLRQRSDCRWAYNQKSCAYTRISIKYFYAEVLLSCAKNHL